MKNWNVYFQALSGQGTASFGALSGAPSLEVTTSPTPRRSWSFDLDSVPRPLFVGLVAAGVAVVAAASYSLGQAYEYERERHPHGTVKASHVRRKPLLGYRKEKEWALREALNRTPSGSTYLGATRRNVA